MAIQRFSSRRGKIGGALSERLKEAVSYDRIAGYFSSSVLEVAGEALDSMAPGAPIRVICNSHLQPLDVLTAKAAKQAIYREWTSSLPENLPQMLKARLERLYELLSSGRLIVKVLPDDYFGLIHGKAGVITGSDGSRICFMGSSNETKSGWELSYELVWLDDSSDGVTWVQEEFDALWASSAAVELAEAVVEDVARLAKRVTIPEVEDWRSEREPDPAAPIVELPVYRRGDGLWTHQKYFVRLAFEQHRQGRARLLLADQVGLGKTIQLALAAKLMTLWGQGRVLILVPKPIAEQWQGELWTLLQMPSARWNGRAWVDERGVEHADRGVDGLARCPRRVGIVSTGLIIQGSEAGRRLASMDYECVILDEAHRARRRNVRKAGRAEPNNLLQFLQKVSLRSKSVLLATATPVQIDPIEAFDLLDALGQGADEVIGSAFSEWRSQERQGLDIVRGATPVPPDVRKAWQWMRDPFPGSEEDRDFGVLRRALDMPDSLTWAKDGDLDRLGPPDRARLEGVRRDFFREHHPYIRRIVRRSREYLETTIDPRTNEPYLQPIRVRLYGEDPTESVVLPGFLRDAYAAAEQFCDEVGKRPGLNSGFLQTLLLRRVGSTMRAGERTARKFLGPAELVDDEDDEGLEETRASSVSSLYPLAAAEREVLREFLRMLDENRAEDPKAREVERLLMQGHQGSGPWLDLGCIVFSQYLDSVNWLAERLSEHLPSERIGIYAAEASSGVVMGGTFTRMSRDLIREEIAAGTMRLVVGTDAASEGLNLQRLGSLINLDLPWNPTRLEQRKGRIQRIGQIRDEVLIYNLRYRESVEDRVHELLSARLQTIRDMFGQLPDTLEDVWVQVALHNDEQARQVIDQVPEVHPFEMRYDRVEPVDFESCYRVLDAEAQVDVLMKGW